MGIALALVLVISVCAEEYELQFEARDMRRSGVYVQGQYTRPRTRSEERLSAEPRYRSKVPLYAALRFGKNGDTRYTIVLDESKGTGRGYDMLYADRNNNGDLTDDPRIMGRIIQRGSNSTMGNFGPVELMVEYGDRTSPCYFFVEYYHYGEQRLRRGASDVQNFQLTLWTGGYYTGNVSFGASERQIAIVDFNCNGIFNESFNTRSMGSGGRLYASGDYVLVDANDDGVFNAGYTDGDEACPCAKYVQVDGRWYSLDISDHGGTVEIQEPDLELGTIEIAEQPSSGSLLLSSANGVLKVQAGQEIQVPVGTYQVYNHSTSISDSSGNWRYNASGTTAGKKFQVTGGNAVAVGFGAPLVINVEMDSRYRRGGRAKAGSTVDLSLTISGQGGETYTSIMRDNGNPPAPTFKAIDEDGKEVAQGTFRYG
jgi:hypothetical protein